MRGPGPRGGPVSRGDTAAPQASGCSGDIFCSCDASRVDEQFGCFSVRLQVRELASRLPGRRRDHYSSSSQFDRAAAPSFCRCAFSSPRHCREASLSLGSGSPIATRTPRRQRSLRRPWRDSPRHPGARPPRVATHALQMAILRIGRCRAARIVCQTWRTDEAQRRTRPPARIA